MTQNQPGAMVCRSRSQASTKMGLTVYGCGKDEAALFQRLAPRLGVTATVTEAALSDTNLELASGNRCVSINHKTRVDNSILLRLSQAGVQYVCTRSIGYDHIDRSYAESVGITVENVAYSADSVADFTLMLILMVARNAISTITRARAHDYRLNEAPGRELRDMTIGVIGTGRIGAAVLRRLRGFGCQVLAHDCCRNTTADYVPLEVLLQQSDLVTLHTPLSPRTRHLLNRQRIEQMRRGAFVVNTGRGALLDTSALLQALESGRLGGAALDVLEGEEGIFYFEHRQRQVENQLLLRLQELPNVVVSPHTAYYTDHALRDIVEHTLTNCLRFESRSAWRG